MGNPVVHFEVTGEDPVKLRSFYGGLFGWEFDTSAPVAPVISEPGRRRGAPVALSTVTGNASISS